MNTTECRVCACLGSDNNVPEVLVSGSQAEPLFPMSKNTKLDFTSEGRAPCQLPRGKSQVCQRRGKSN